MQGITRTLTSVALLCGSLSLIGGYTTAAERDAQVRQDLNGRWQFRLDPNDEGVAGQWFAAGVAYLDEIQVPGNWQAQGFGPSQEHIRHNYQGKAWYRRTVLPPAEWAGKRIWLCLGGVANTADVYVNGKKVGAVESGTVPCEFDVTDALKPDAENVIACHVDSTGPARGGLSNYVCRWGGLYREAHLEARSDPAVNDLFVIPDEKNRTARVQVTLARTAGGPEWKGQLRVRITPVTGGAAAEGQGEAAIAVGCQESDAATVHVAIPNMRPWSPEDPFLYDVEVSVLADGCAIDMVYDRFGMRQFEVGPGGVLMLNGRPYFVRGIGDDTVEVISGTQYPDKKIYIERLKQIKRYGFNGVRFLGNTPIPEYFQAADEVGVLVMAEGHEYTKDKSTIPLLRKDVARIAKTYRNHPSWYIWSAGNELFACQGATPDREWMDYILFAHQEFKKLDPTRFFVASDGADVFPTDIVTQFGRFDGNRQIAAPEQPFHGLIDEVAYFKRALDDTELAKVADRKSGTGGEYAKMIQSLRPSGYWRLDETSLAVALDSSGNNQLGTYDPTMTPDDLGRPGAIDPSESSRAIHTSAQRKGVRLKTLAGTAFAAENEPFSVSFWVNPDGFAPGDYGTPFSYGAAQKGGALVIAEDGGAGTGKLLLGRYDESFLLSNGALVAGQWNHIGITHDGSELTLYLNGKFDKREKVTMATVHADARIGGCVTRLMVGSMVNDQAYRERPQIWHEFPNAYIGPLPDLTAADKWTGVYQDPNCIANSRRHIADLGLSERYPAIRERSVEQFRGYLKHQFESARQSPTMDGYAYWCMTDYTAGPEGEMTTYGMFNTVYEPDKFPTPEPVLQFNRETVLLVDAGPADRVVESGKTRNVQLSISHYGAQPIVGGHALWTLQSGDKIVRQGAIEPIGAGVGEVKLLGTIALLCPALPMNPSAGSTPANSAATAVSAVESRSLAASESIEPSVSGLAQRLRLLVRLESDACRQENQWDFWAFPAITGDLRGQPIVNRTGLKELDARYGIDANRPVEQARLVLANRATPEVMEDLSQGRSVLLLAEQGVLAHPGGFSFWPPYIRTSAAVIEEHPTLARFPHDGFCDFQFFRLFDGGLETIQSSDKGSIGRERLVPIVWGLSQDPDPSLGTDWFVPKNRWKMCRHTIICEGRVEGAKILVCSLRVIRGILAGQVEAGYLLDSLVRYTLSEQFAPAEPPVTLAEFSKLLKGDVAPLP
jgi:hypothetical protein